MNFHDVGRINNVVGVVVAMMMIILMITKEILRDLSQVRRAPSHFPPLQLRHPRAVLGILLARVGPAQHVPLPPRLHRQAHVAGRNEPAHDDADEAPGRGVPRVVDDLAGLAAAQAEVGEQHALDRGGVPVGEEGNRADDILGERTRGDEILLLRRGGGRVVPAAFSSSFGCV